MALEERDLLPNHGWFPKLFQNIFILKSHKRMFSETKVERKETFFFCNANKRLTKNGTTVHIKNPTNQSNSAKQHSQRVFVFAARSRSILTSHSCTGHSSNTCCFSLAGCRMCATMTGRIPKVQKRFYIPSTVNNIHFQFFSFMFFYRWDFKYRDQVGWIHHVSCEKGVKVCFLHRCLMQSCWSDAHTVRHAEAWGPAVQKWSFFIVFHCTILHCSSLYFSVKYNKSEGKNPNPNPNPYHPKSIYIIDFKCFFWTILCF